MMKTASLRCAHLMLGLNCLPYIFNKSLLAMQTLKPLKDVIAIEIASQQLVTNMMGSLLADYGAKVTRVGESFENTYLSKSKELVQNEFSVQGCKELVQEARAIIIHEDCPSLDPLLTEIQLINPKAIVLVVHRINQKFKQKFHDVQLLALSGLLSHFGQTDNLDPSDNLPVAPPFLASIVSAVGAATRLLQAIKENQTGVIRFSMLHSVMYLGNFHLNSFFVGLTDGKRGSNFLEGGAPFYRIYESKDSFLAVGNIEPKFYQEMVKGLFLDEKTEEYLKENQMNVSEWPKMQGILQQVFRTKTTMEWTKMMDLLDTCVTPINTLCDPSEIQPSPRLSSHTQKLILPSTNILPRL